MPRTPVYKSDLIIPPSNIDNLGRVEVKNVGAKISAGDIVAVVAADSSALHVKLADANAGDISQTGKLLVALQTIAATDGRGYCANWYKETGLNTSSLSVGAPIYLSDTAGARTSAAPAVRRQVGIVTVSHASTGEYLLWPAQYEARRADHASIAASSEHEDTTTEALFDTTYTIPANTLKVGSVIKIKYMGIVVDNNSSDTLTIKLYLGGLSGTALLTGTATDVADNDIFCGEATVVVRTVGGSGTFIAYGTLADVPAASGTAAPKYEAVASTAIDTTAAQVIGVGADWSAAHQDNECRLEMLVVEIL